MITISIRDALKTGIGFGLTSAVITTLGLMVGLNSGTHSRLAVVGGVLVIAIADAFSDALGIHISQEASNSSSTKEIWQATAATFFAKLIFASTFIIPILLLPLDLAVKTSVVYGLSLLGIFSYFIAKNEKTEPWKVIAEHVVIAAIVITITYFVGIWIGTIFGK